MVITAAASGEMNWQPGLVVIRSGFPSAATTNRAELIVIPEY